MNKQPSSRSVTETLEAGSLEFLKQTQEDSTKLSTWAKLYTASQTLLAATREKRVVPALVEICSNLLACEELAIVEVERAGKAVRLLGEEGLSSEQRAALMRNPESLEARIEPGILTLPESEEPSDHILAPLKLSAIIPLWRDRQSSAAMLLFQLLPQRTEFDAEDREVLRLLSSYAGPCLRCQTHE